MMTPRPEIDAMPNRVTHAQPSGTTLTELLVVIVVLSLLASIAVPVAINRSTQGKISAARADVKALANAEEMVGMIHGFYLPLQVLDDIAGIGIDPEDDAIEAENGLNVINVNVPIRSGAAQVIITSGDGQVRRMIETWQGPFISLQRFFMSNIERLDTDARLDHPLDPWRTPYILYAPNGVVGSGAGSFAESNQPIDLFDLIGDRGFSDGQLLQRDDRFDRWAVVSFGPDGVSGDITGGGQFDLGDDIVHFFGHVVIPLETDVGGTPSIGRVSRPSATQRRRR